MADVEFEMMGCITYTVPGVVGIAKAPIRVWNEQYGVWGEWEEATLVKGKPRDMEHNKAGAAAWIGWVDFSGFDLCAVDGRYEVWPGWMEGKDPSTDPSTLRAAKHYRDAAKSALLKAIALNLIDQGIERGVTESIGAGVDFNVSNTLDGGVDIHSRFIPFVDGHWMGGVRVKSSPERCEADVVQVMVTLLLQIRMAEARDAFNRATEKASKWLAPALTKAVLQVKNHINEASNE